MAAVELTLTDDQLQALLLEGRGLAAVLEAVLNRALGAEITEHLGAAPHERTSTRRGHRNGSYERDLTVRVGTIERRVPRDREGTFRTELFERYQRSERALVLARRIGTRTNLPITCAIIAVAPTLVYFSAIAKQYTLDTLVAIVLYLTVIDSRGALRPARQLAVLSLAGAVAVWFSHPSIFVLTGILAVQLVSMAKHRSWREAGGLLLFHAAWMGSFLAFYMVNISRAARSDYLRAYWHAHFAPFPPASLADFQWYGSRFLGLFKIPLGLSVLIALGAVAFFYGVIVLYRRAPQSVLLLLAPLLMAVTASALTRTRSKSDSCFFSLPRSSFSWGKGWEPCSSIV